MEIWTGEALSARNNYKFSKLKRTQGRYADTNYNFETIPVEQKKKGNKCSLRSFAY